MRIRLSLAILFSFSALFAQWTAKNCFEPKVFVENKGQFKIDPSVSSGEILFGARQDGMQYYFTRDAVLIRHAEVVKTENETGEKELTEFRSKPVEKWHVMKFLGTSQSAKIEPGAETNAKHHFGTPDNQTIVASAFKKIVYEGLYPNIDMEFEFPEDKQGFKYSFIVHPGGDVTNINIEYPLAKSIKLQDGNVVISSAIGEFIDHTPVSFQNGNTISSSFAKGKKNHVLFNLASYDKTNDVIVDPWTSTPVFSGANNAFDVDWDYAGNCYVYGGVAPFQVIKFNSTGNPIWTFTAQFPATWYYGDFAVDRASGTLYIVNGFATNGAEVMKVNNSGLQSGFLAGDTLMQEMWRVAFDACNSRVIIGGGGTTNPSYSGCSLDTSLAAPNRVNVLNSSTGLHDFWGLAIDGLGEVYLPVSKTQVGTPVYDNYLLKVPAPALTPIIYATATTYSFVEVASVNYAPGPPNGFNGVALSDTNVFLYDGYVLSRYNNLNGAFSGSVSINGTSQSTMTYGGLTSDGCGNLYLGLHNTVKQYDANLNPINSFPMPSNVYDVNVSNGILYSCGMGFVSAIAVGGTTCIPCHGEFDVASMLSPDVKIYPNPTSGQLFIEGPFIFNSLVEIINSIGQTVKKIQLHDRRTSISIGDLPVGIYSILLKTGDKQIKKLIVKSNP